MFNFASNFLATREKIFPLISTIWPPTKINTQFGAPFATKYKNYERNLAHTQQFFPLFAKISSQWHWQERACNKINKFNDRFTCIHIMIKNHKIMRQKV